MAGERKHDPVAAGDHFARPCQPAGFIPGFELKRLFTVAGSRLRIKDYPGRTSHRTLLQNQVRRTANPPKGFPGKSFVIAPPLPQPYGRWHGVLRLIRVRADDILRKIEKGKEVLIVTPVCPAHLEDTVEQDPIIPGEQALSPDSGPDEERLLEGDHLFCRKPGAMNGIVGQVFGMNKRLVGRRKADGEAAAGARSFLKTNLEKPALQLGGHGGSNDVEADVVVLFLSYPAESRIF